jgi:virginiamycin B lyase
MQGLTPLFPKEGVSMTRLFLIAAVAVLTTWSSPVAGQSETYDLKEWDVEWGGRTRDPAVAPDGTVWFVGQAGNYVATFDPKSGQFKRYDIEDGTNPHTVVVDENGIAWYAGNRNGRIGRIDPATGDIKTFMTGEARDPHTMVFDGKGHIWFTSQGSNRVGRLHMASGKVDLVAPHDQPSNPYGIVLDPQGHPWVALLRTNLVAKIDPATMEVTRFEQADEKSRSRRIEVTPDGMVWTGDEARGYLIRIDPSSGETREWQAPGGAGARPYALTRDGQGRLWFSETGPEKRLVGFDPKTSQFFATIPVSGTIRHMHFDEATSTLWFGTDANKVGRIVTGKATS